MSETVCAIDIETYDPHLHEWGAGSIRGDGYILGIGAYCPEMGVDAYYRPEDPSIRKLLEHDVTKVFHNAVYDVDWLMHGPHHFTINGRIEDTMTRETLLDAYDFSYSLERCCAKHGVEGKNKADTIEQWWKDQGHKTKAVEHLREMPWNVVARYCRQDCKATYDLYHAQEPLLEEQGLKYASNIECKLYPWLMHTRANGMIIDQRARRALSDKLNEELEECQHTFISSYGDININSSAQLAKLFESLGIPVRSYTEKGSPSLGADALAEYDHPIAKEILHIRMLDKLLGTFIDGQFVDLAYNSRLYPTLYPAKRDSSGGTVTGRFSCLAIGTNVFTVERGYVPIEALRIGEHVVTHTGTVRPIKAIMFTGVREVGYHNNLLCTASHLLFDGERWVSAELNPTAMEVDENELIRRQRLSQESSGFGFVPVSGQANKRGSLRTSWCMFSICSSRGYPARYLGSGEGSQVLPLQAWREESEELCWGSGRWPRVPTEESEREVLLYASDSNGRGAWYRCIGDARLGGHTPHRWKSEEQRVEEPLSGDSSWTQALTRRVSVDRRWEPIGIIPTFDIEVGGPEHSFVAEGVIVHNSQNPNGQNIPAREDKHGPEVRSLFIPEEGHLLGAFDYKQIEYRIFMHFAYSIKRGGIYHLPAIEDIHDRFEAGESIDYHELVQRMMGWWFDDDKGRTKAFRHVTKNLNFGSIYGLGYRSFATRFKGPLLLAHPNTKDEDLPMLAKTLQDRYYTKIPFVRPTMDEIQKIARERGYVKTVGGRRQRLTKDGKLYKMVNYLIQGSAGDLFKKAMIDAWEAGVFNVLKCHVMVHDEVVFSIPQTKEGYEACVTLKECMSNAYKLHIPIGVDTEIGPDWGHCNEDNWNRFMTGIC